MNQETMKKVKIPAVPSDDDDDDAVGAPLKRTSNGVTINFLATSLSTFLVYTIRSGRILPRDGCVCVD